MDHGWPRARRVARRTTWDRHQSRCSLVSAAEACREAMVSGEEAGSAQGSERAPHEPSRIAAPSEARPGAVRARATWRCACVAWRDRPCVSCSTASHSCPQPRWHRRSALLQHITGLTYVWRSQLYHWTCNASTVRYFAAIQCGCCLLIRSNTSATDPPPCRMVRHSIMLSTPCTIGGQPRGEG